MTKSIIAALLLAVGVLAAGQTLNLWGTAPNVPPQSKIEGTNVDNQTTYTSVFPQHEPYGTGFGAMPGRVTWVHNAKSVKWDGGGYRWQLKIFDSLYMFLPYLITMIILSHVGIYFYIFVWN